MKKRFTLFFIFFIFLTGQIIGLTNVYFSPDDKPAEKLIEKINNVKEKIQAAIFVITNKKIENALIEAKKRNVDIKIITDPGSLPTQQKQIKNMLENNIPVFIYNPKIPTIQKTFSDRMHNKFCILDKSVWTGSFNWTYYADNKNQENVIFTTKNKVVSNYENQFEKIKKERCEPLTIKKLEELISVQQKPTNNETNKIENLKIYSDLKSKIKKLLEIIQKHGKEITI
ncbi:MAG: phospholipase D-like domain-containing protein [bacterium]